MADNIHDVKIDPRNLDILISVNGKLVPRAEAMVSVFDSGFILGDGVWEGLRMVKGGVPFLREHIERLYEGAKAIFMDIGLDAGRTGEAPVRLPRRQQDGRRRPHPPHGHARRQGHPLSGPARHDLGKPTIVIIPEYKTPNPEKTEKGLSLHTVNVRRGYPDVQDQKLNSHSKLNCITACIQAANAGADEALMLDPLGLRRHLQLHPFLHRAPRRIVDLDRAVLHPRHHPRQHDPAGEGPRHSGLREAVLAL